MMGKMKRVRFWSCHGMMGEVHGLGVSDPMRWVSWERSVCLEGFLRLPFSLEVVVVLHLSRLVRSLLQAFEPHPFWHSQ